MSKEPVKTSEDKEATSTKVSEFEPRVINPKANGKLNAQDQGYMAAIVPVELMQQVVDLLRNEPLPYKMTSPLVNALGRVVVTKVNSVQE